ncbi:MULTISPECIES: DUF7507 domain-containing protein [Lysobacter]|uniref:DUF7507 domain-containing protein n=1 Tax=Lysobacter TaxID=68 RepID=UPI001F392BD0|nr:MULTISPECIES: hypothetical protein [Lysobacter]UJB19502.1 hypothetical protein L1A79_24930 [Lysobacter capsici]UJQ26772.1 hypothetical protein L2D09_14955 [Lysobacter gummosus]
MLVALPAFSQNAVNRGSVSPPNGVTNPGTNCNQAGQTFVGGVCTSQDSDPIRPRLTLVKTVTNDNGGTAVATAWTLTATAGTTTITGATGTANVTNASVPAGTYTLSESGGPTGYTAGTYSCVINSGAAIVSNTVTLAAGDNATCTINNNDQAASLTLVKNITNDNGGTATVTDFSLTTNAGTLTFGANSGTAQAAVYTSNTLSVSAGTYTLTEADRAGYTEGDWSCTGAAGTVTPAFNAGSVVIAGGETVTCSITNNDQAASLTLVKNITNDNGGTATVADFSLTTNAGTLTFGANSGTPQAAVYTSNTLSVSAGTYTLTEADRAGYTEGDWSCTGAAGTVTPAFNAGSVVIAGGETVTCSITNNDQAATLTLVKTVTNDNGGTAVATAWTLGADGPTDISGASGAPAVTDAAVNAGTYTLSETGGPAGYTAGAWACTGGGTLTGDSLVLAGGEDVTCSITNNDRAATLTLEKTVVNDNGGTATVTNFPLTATGPTTITGTSGATAVTDAAVSAGTYTLSETNVAGYTAGNWACTGGGTLTGDSLVLAGGEDVTCSITNNDQAATLTLEKTVVNDNGGTATVANFPLTATGPTTITGTSGATAVTDAAVSAGTYTLSETNVTGYTAGAWACTGGGTLTGDSLVLAGGEDVTCSITNNDRAATLTLEKTVVNDNGGTATVTNFPLTATGPTTITGTSGATAVTDAAVSAGTYTLSETNVAGYTAGNWACTGGGTLTGDSLVLAGGEDVTCSITNNDQAASLTLVKNITNDNGGTATVTAFGLTTDAGTLTFGANSGTPQNAVYTSNTLSVSAGTYTLSESDVAGYTEGNWSCTGAAGAVTPTFNAGSVVIAGGETVTCSITNNDDAASLTLVKNITNDNGGTATVTAFGLTTDAGTLTFGANSGTPQNAVYTSNTLSVSAGTYTLSESDVAGYTEGNWSCTGVAGAVTPTFNAGSVVIAGGETVTCSITNNDQAASLTLVKNITNDNGGTATVTAFGLTTDAGTLTFGANSGTPQNAVYTSNTLSVSAGTYTLSESDVAGYTEGNWSCTGAAGAVTPTFNAGSVVIAGGETVTCSITNNDDAASLTLVKNITNDNGGTATVTAFGLTTDAGTLTFGANSGTPQNAVYTSNTLSVSAGTYTLSESDVAGYTEGNWSCTGVAGAVTPTFNAGSVVIAGGETVTCSITNNDQAASLTLVKNITNDNGGTATVTAFGLTTDAGTLTFGANSGTPQNAVYTSNTLSVSAGTYTLSESDVAGYTEGNWSCTGAAGAVTPTFNAGSVVIAGGETVTCSITNNDDAASLTLVKNVTNDNGGTATVTNFPLTATGPTTITGTSGATAVTDAAVSAGTYILSETNVAGYSAGNWACTGGGTLTGDSLVLAGGDDATCSITNDDQAVDLTSVKTQTTNDDEDGSGSITVNDTLHYTIRVTNTGSATLSNVVVRDDKITPNSVTCATLAPNAFCDLAGSYKVQQSDANAGSIVNRATVTAESPPGLPPPCPPGSTEAKCNPTVTVPVPQAPALTSTKAVTGNADEDGNGTVSVGDTLTYAVTVTNTGNVDLVNVVVSDVKLTPNTITCATLAPKATCVLTGTYKVQQADGNAGKVVNTATVKTDTPNTCPLGSPDPQCNPKHEEPVPQAPALTSTKAVTGNADEDGNGAVSVGDTLTYAVTVTNTGNVDLVNVVVSDVKLTPNTITCATLAPKATCVLTGTYKVQQADGNAGKVVNTATVKTDTPNVCPLGSPDPQCNPKHEEPVPQAPALTSTKAVTGNADEDGNGAVSVGDTLTYAVTVTNTGNVDLVNVVVSDVKLTPNTITCATLVPKAADVTASKTHATGSIEPVSDNDRFDDGFLIDGRLAFYLKGKVRGKYLITAQADTQEREVGQLFNGFWKADPQDVFRRLDPDLYYPVYGDDSTTYRDVDTMGRLYLRMGWDKNQALWGNFNTGFTGTEYAQYNRSLYGGALDWRSRRTTALGDAGTQLRLFGSQAQTAPGHTELIGTGGRLYYLKHGDILPGSEKLTVEVRDTTTGRVQNRVDLMRGADYEIDELQGRILLDKPLSQVSRDGLRTLTHDTPLDGYLQVLLVDYEYVPDGLDVDNVSAGFRGKHWFGDHLAVGGTYVDENREGEDYTLKGADLTLQAGRGTYLKLEGSRSQATSAPIFFSDNGGLSFRELNSGLLAREGEARSAEARANFKELGWTENEWTVAAWRRHVSAGYSISRYDTDQAVEERGFEFFGELTPAVRLFGRHSIAERGKESFTQSQLTGEWRLNDDITFSGEVRTVQEDRLSGDATGTLAALEYRQRIGSQLELFGTAQVTVDDDHGKYADNDAFSLGAKYLFGDRSSVGAEVTSGDRGDAAKVDAEYRLAPDHTLYGSYTYSTNTREQDPLFNDRLNSGWTLGQRWRLSNQVSLFNESQFLKAPNESGLAHTYGMDFYPSEGWNLGFTLQEATLDRAAELGQVNRRAVSVSGGRNSVDTQWSSKLEWRRDSGAERREQWTSSNRFLHKLNDSFRIAGRLNYSQTRDRIDAQAGAKFVEGNLGFSWRPYNDTRWALLGKYTFLYDLSALEQVGPNIASYDQRTQVLSFEGIYHPNHHWEFAGKLARREGEVRYGRLQGQWADSATTFAAAQARYEFAQVWHGLAEYRWLGVKKGGDKQGLLLGIDRDIGKNFRVGVGYNFTEFSDDLTDFDYDHRGWFLNMVGSY